MHVKCQHLASEEGEKPQVEGRPCDARAELGSDVGMWESFVFPAGKLSNEYLYVHTHQEGRKMLETGVQVTKVLKWHHFLLSEDPQGERIWGLTWLSFRQAPFICPFITLS